MTDVKSREKVRRGPTNEARSPYYALLAQLRLRAVEATWMVRRPERDPRREGSGGKR